MKGKIKLSKYCSKEHNDLMSYLIKNINGVTVIEETTEDDEVVLLVEIQDSKINDVLKQLDACDIIVYGDTKAT